MATSMTSSRSWTGDRFVESKMAQQQCDRILHFLFSRHSVTVWRFVDVQAFRYAYPIFMRSFIKVMLCLCLRHSSHFLEPFRACS